MTSDRVGCDGVKEKGARVGLPSSSAALSLAS